MSLSRSGDQVPAAPSPGQGDAETISRGGRPAGRSAGRSAGGRTPCGVRVAAHLVDGAVHGRAGLHDRQRRAALDSARLARRHDHAAVADQRLCGRLRGVLAAGRPAGRRVRAGQTVPDRLGRVRGGEHRRGAGRRAWPADRLPGGPGHRGGHAGSRGPVPAGHQLSRPAGTQPRPGHLRRDRLDGICRGRGAGRPAGRGHVASGVLCERSGRPGAADRLVPAAATGSAQQQGAAGRARRHHRHGGGRPARVRGRPGGRHAEGHRAGAARSGPRSCCWARSPSGRGGRAPRFSTWPCSRTAASWAPTWR